MLLLGLHAGVVGLRFRLGFGDGIVVNVHVILLILCGGAVCRGRGDRRGGTAAAAVLALVGFEVVQCPQRVAHLIRLGKDRFGLSQLQLFFFFVFVFTVEKGCAISRKKFFATWMAMSVERLSDESVMCCWIHLGSLDRLSAREKRLSAKTIRP